jgi:Asp-tRNA(Asn)/Glu-tRNA(Gln) amidotransferase B subunit
MCSILEQTVNEICVRYEPQAVEYKQGNDKYSGFLVAQVMKKLNNQADPRAVSMLLKKKLRG